MEATALIKAVNRRRRRRGAAAFFWRSNRWHQWVKRLEGSNMFQDSLGFESLPRCSVTAEKTSHLELTVMTQ